VSARAFLRHAARVLCPPRELGFNSFAPLIPLRWSIDFRCALPRDALVQAWLTANPRDVSTVFTRAVLSIDGFTRVRDLDGAP
jgi:hypothetical protein